MIRSILKLATHFLPERVIKDRDGRRPYLSRWYLKGKPRMADGSSPFNDEGNPKPGAIWPDGVGIYLHRFHVSDGPGVYHSHPWAWMWSLILAGGYVEETPSGRRRVLPFTVNRLTNLSLHRVDLIEEDCWTMFVTGPKSSNWGFLPKGASDVIPWREYLAGVRQRGV